MLVVSQIIGLWADDRAHLVLVIQKHRWNKNISCHLGGWKYDEGSWYDVYLTTRIIPSNTLATGPLIHKPAIGYDPEIIPVAFHPHSLFAQDPYEFYPTPILVQILQLFFASQPHTPPTQSRVLYWPNYAWWCVAPFICSVLTNINMCYSINDTTTVITKILKESNLESLNLQIPIWRTTAYLPTCAWSTI